MASVKVKFRPSTVNGREGTLYYQVIHNRVVRQINTEYKLFVSEWDCHSETVVLHHLSTEQERNNYLLSIGSRIKWDKDRLNKIIHTLSQSGTFVTDDIVMRFHDNSQEQSFNAYISQQIARLKRLGKIRTSETYTAALRSFSGFMNDKEVLLEIVRSCSKKGLRSRWSCLTSDMVAYIKFLENTSEDDMDDSDRAVYEQLKLWLG